MFPYNITENKLLYNITENIFLYDKEQPLSMRVTLCKFSSVETTLSKTNTNLF